MVVGQALYQTNPPTLGNNWIHYHVVMWLSHGENGNSCEQFRHRIFLNMGVKVLILSSHTNLHLHSRSVFPWAHIICKSANYLQPFSTTYIECVHFIVVNVTSWNGWTLTPLTCATKEARTTDSHSTIFHVSDDTCRLVRKAPRAPRATWDIISVTF